MLRIAVQPFVLSHYDPKHSSIEPAFIMPDIWYACNLVSCISQRLIVHSAHDILGEFLEADVAENHFYGYHTVCCTTA